MNSQIKQPRFKSELPDRPLEMVATDFFNFDNGNYLVLADYYTIRIEAISIPRQTASVVVNALKNVFARLGFPKIVRSDNGPCYNSKEFLELAEAYGFYSITINFRYSESNRLARTVRTVRTPLSKLVDWVVDYDGFENKDFEQKQLKKLI